MGEPPSGTLARENKTLFFQNKKALPSSYSAYASMHTVSPKSWVKYEQMRVWPAIVLPRVRSAEVSALGKDAAKGR